MSVSFDKPNPRVGNHLDWRVYSFLVKVTFVNNNVKMSAAGFKTSKDVIFWKKETDFAA